LEVSLIGGGNRSTRRKLPTCPKSQEFTPIFSWIRVARSLLFCVVICRLLLVLFSFCYHCVVCPSSIDGFWLHPLCIFKLFSLANIIPLCFIEYISLWSGFKLTILVVIGTDSTGNCKSHYHTIPIMPLGIWECVPFFRVYLPHDHCGPFKCCLQYFKKTFYMLAFVCTGIRYTNLKKDKKNIEKN
jgi:hypothetical protein